jgi:hypothetical protein
VGARRDDITGNQRARIAIEVLYPDREWGTVSRLAREYQITRKTIYDIRDAAERLLRRGLEPGPHGPCPAERTIGVDRNRLARGTVVLTGEGVSQRGVAGCLEELLDTRLSPSWVNRELAKLETMAAVVNEGWQPVVGETLAGDEIYSNGQPNLLMVGNDSLYIYALTRQPECDGDTWGCVLLEAPDCRQFASDGGKGLAAGVQAAGIEGHQLDWDHLLRPVWGQVSRLEKQACAALEAVEERAAKFERAHTTKRLEQHLAAWERLSAKAEMKMKRHDAFFQIAQQVDARFALIDLESGQVQDPVAGAEGLRRVGKQLQPWEGRIYQKLSRNLDSFAEGLFNYQPVLSQTLAPLIERWGPQAIQALSRIWQIEADEKRHPLPRVARQARQAMWQESLDEALSRLGEEQLWQAWDALSQVLGRPWRGSMLAECVNSLLRPILDGRKHTDQGCLELFRFLHNVHPFERGKRAGHSPAQLVGLDVPHDPLILLGLSPKVSSMERGGMFPVDKSPLSHRVQGLPKSPDTETAVPFNLIFPLCSPENQKVFI